MRIVPGSDGVTEPILSDYDADNEEELSYNEIYARWA